MVSSGMYALRPADVARPIPLSNSNTQPSMALPRQPFTSSDWSMFDSRPVGPSPGAGVA